MDIVAIGAHSDDIELGAAALIRKVSRLGFRTYFVVLTDEKAGSALRRTEARQAAAKLGVPRERVIFAGLPDSYLRADGNTVRIVRNLARDRGIAPKLVVTHTQADSHNDHVEANRIAHAAFRGCAFLHYSIHVSAEVDRFAPRVFIDVSGASLEVKEQALSAYHSQKATINRYDLSKYEAGLGALADLDRAEGFEVSFQSNAPNVSSEIIALSESPFHRFWTPIIGDDRVTLLYETYTPLVASDCGSGLNENLGRDRLRQAFLDRWIPSTPLIERYSICPDASSAVMLGNVILSGSPASNPVVRFVYDSLQHLTWAIEGGESFSRVPYLYNRNSGQRFYAKTGFRQSLRHDVGLISRVSSPFDTDRRIICVLGATSYASRVGLEFLSNPGSQPILDELFRDQSDCEVAFTVESQAASIDVIDVQR